MKCDKLIWRVFVFILAFILTKTFNSGWWMLFVLFAFVDGN